MLGCTVGKDHPQSGYPVDRSVFADNRSRLGCRRPSAPARTAVLNMGHFLGRTESAQELWARVKSPPVIVALLMAQGAYLNHVGDRQQLEHKS
jgi:hypothetical protein